MAATDVSFLIGEISLGGQYFVTRNVGVSGLCFIQVTSNREYPGNHETQCWPKSGDI